MASYNKDYVLTTSTIFIIIIFLPLLSYCQLCSPEPCLGHGESCTAADNCSVNLTCTDYTNENQNRCLCNQNYFFKNAICVSVDTLRVSAVTITDTGIDYISLTWTPNNADIKNVAYHIEINGQSPIVANSTGGTIKNLTPGQSYTIKIVSTLSETFYPEMTTFYPFGNVTTKKSHIAECDGNEECSTPFVCRTDKQNTKRCLCLESYYYTSSNNSCTSVDSLKVSAALDTKGTDFITLKWTASKPDNIYVVYYMETNGQSVQANTTSGTIRNLQAGQSYTITVISSLQADPWYPTMNTSVQYGPVTTIKTHGQECQTSSECQGPLVCKIYINTKTFCLCATNWFYNGSSGCVSIDSLKVSPSLDTKGTDFITLKWTASKPDNRNVVYYMETNGQSVQTNATSGTIRNLQAGQSYTITVISSLQADTLYPTMNTSVQYGPVTTASASNLISLSATPTRSTDNRVGLIIAWIPGDFTGPTNYTIVLESEKSLMNNEFQIDKTVTVSNYETRNFTFPDLLAYWKYRVSVYAYTSKGAGATLSIVRQTFMNVPGIAQFQLMSNSTMALDIYITITCPAELERNGTITGYIILKKLVSTSNINEIENSRVQKIEAPNSCETTLSVLLNDLLVERTYLIQIMTINGQYQGSYSIDKALYTAPKVPRLQEMFPDKTIVEIITTTETTLVAKVCRTCLTDERQGLVKDLMLVVCGEKSDCYANARRRRSLKSYQNWSAAKKSDFIIGYQATPRHWIEQLEGSTEEFVNYIVGSSGNCKSDDNEFCNGPLPSNTKFKLLVIQCNNAGCDAVSSGSLSTQDADDKNIGLWVFLGVGLFLFIILLAGVAFCVKRIHNRRKSEARVEIDPYDKVNRTYQDDHQYGVLQAGTSISSNNLMENVSAPANTDNVYHEIHDYSNYPERDIGSIPKLDNNKLNRAIVYDNIAFNSS